MRKNPLVVVLGLSAFFFTVFLGISVVTVMMLTSGRPTKKIFGKSNNIGVLELNGVIIDSKKILDQIETFDEDSLIKAVILRINSPGGAVAPSQEIYEAVRQLAKKKPVYSSMSSVAASGGYYVAVGAKKVYANPGTITGSIGVIMQFADMSKLYQWAKVSPYNIKTGKFKDIGSPNREMSIEEKALLQDMIDNVLSQFRRAVSVGRGLPMSKVVELSDGRIFSGEQAKTAKLVDELGGFNDVVEAIAKDAGITGKPHLVYASKKRKMIERLLHDLDDSSDSESSSWFDRIGALANTLDSLLGGKGLSGGGLPSSSRLLGPLFLMPNFSGE